MAQNSALTLTQTAFWTRRIIKWGTIGIIAILLLRATWSIGKQIYLKLNPPPPPPATHGFGIIPEVKFPSREITAELSYQLETPQGTLPKFPDQAKVYYIPQPRSTFSALDQAKQTALALGFRTSPEEIDKDIIYRFTNPQTQETLLTNIITGTFKLDRPWASDNTLLSGQPQSQDAAAKFVASYLQTARLMDKDLLTLPPTFNFLKGVPPRLEPVASLSESNFVKVNFFRGPYDNLPVVTPDPSEALVNFIIGARNTIIQAEYYHYIVLADRAETYPLITAQDAWNQLTSGKAYIARVDSPVTAPIKIRKVFLAYFDSKELQEFFQPVIVFEGDQNFTAYVPAITSPYLKPS